MSSRALQEPNIGARHAAVHDIANDRHFRAQTDGFTSRIENRSSKACVGWAFQPSPALMTLTLLRARARASRRCGVRMSLYYGVNAH